MLRPFVLYPPRERPFQGAGVTAGGRGGQIIVICCCAALRQRAAPDFYPAVGCSAMRPSKARAPILEFRPTKTLREFASEMKYTDAQPSNVPAPGARADIPCIAKRTPVPVQLEGRVPPELWETTYDAIQERLWDDMIAQYLVHDWKYWECICCPVALILGLGGFDEKRKRREEANQNRLWAAFQQDQQVK